MRRRAALRSSRRVFVVAGTILGVACQTPAPAPAPQPVKAAPQLVPAPVSMVLAGGSPFEVVRTANIIGDTNNAELRAIGEALAAQIRGPTGVPVVVSTMGA